MVEVEKPLVTITGISGYIGAETTLQFLRDGGFRIRGTVRDMNNQAKLEPLRQAFGDLFNQIELFQADLSDADSLMAAIAGATYVVHLASPISGNFTTADEYIRPAVDGTMAVVRACAQHGVRRCVITSSMAAMINMPQEDKPAIFDESYWSVTEHDTYKIGNYGKSKTLAEKAAWDFQASLPTDQRFELVTICPGFVMGPPLRTEHSASVGFIKRLMLGQMQKISDDGCAVVDVREVAQAHLNAIKLPAAANRRFFLVNYTAKFIEYAQPIIDKYVPLGWPITTQKGEPNPNVIMTQMNNAASREILGIQYRDFTQTMTDMADKCVELGIVTKPTSD